MNARHRCTDVLTTPSAIITVGLMAASATLVSTVMGFVQEEAALVSLSLHCT